MSKRYIKIKDIVIIAMFSAILTTGKLALMAIPNIEIVTFFIILYSYSFGLKISLPATLIFCIMEGLLFGLNTWLVSYFIYFPLLATVSYFIARTGLKNPLIYTILAGFMTALFGVISSAVDAVVASNFADVNFFIMFSIIYTRGILFYLAHIISNIVFVVTVFPLLSAFFKDLKIKYYN